jgi:hypothetical protein
MDESLSQEQARESKFAVLEPRRILAALFSFARTHAAELIGSVLLAVMSLQMLTVISRKSITNDEIVMIPAAYYHLAAANFQLVNEHPPLAKIAAAVPLLFVQPDEVRSDQISAPPDSLEAKLAYENSFWENNQDRFASLSYWPRVPMIGLTILLGILIFRFARELFGDRAAVLAVALFSLEPTVLAHGRVVQTDVPAALGYLLFFMALYRYTNRPDWRHAAWLGATTGIAILAKYSMLITGPVLACYFATKLRQGWRAHERERVIGHAAIVLALMFVIINAAYFFKHPALAAADTKWIADSFTAHSSLILGSVKVLSYVLPKDFVLGIVFQFWHNGVGHSAGLLGMYSQRGWWYYFPVAFALKSTLPFLIASLFAIAWGTYQLIKRRDRRFLWLLIPLALYTGFVLFSHINIGVRYYLPAYPFLILLVAAMLDRALAARKRHLAGLAVITLMIWTGVEAVRAFPDHMSYLNELAWRHPHWYYLSDSNVEWGDDVSELAAYLLARGETRVRAATLGGFVTLRYYGVDYLDAMGPVEDGSSLPLYTAIGASFLNGSTVSTDVPGQHPQDFFKDYRSRTPEAVFGNSIYLYRER